MLQSGAKIQGYTQQERKQDKRNDDAKFSPGNEGRNQVKGNLHADGPCLWDEHELVKHRLGIPEIGRKKQMTAFRIQSQKHDGILQKKKYIGKCEIQEAERSDVMTVADIHVQATVITAICMYIQHKRVCNGTQQYRPVDGI